MTQQTISLVQMLLQNESFHQDCEKINFTNKSQFELFVEKLTNQMELLCQLFGLNQSNLQILSDFENSIVCGLIQSTANEPFNAVFFNLLKNENGIFGTDIYNDIDIVKLHINSPIKLNMPFAKQMQEMAKNKVKNKDFDNYKVNNAYVENSGIYSVFEALDNCLQKQFIAAKFQSIEELASKWNKVEFSWNEPSFNEFKFYSDLEETIAGIMHDCGYDSKNSIVLYPTWGMEFKVKITLPNSIIEVKFPIILNKFKSTFDKNTENNNIVIKLLQNNQIVETIHSTNGLYELVAVFNKMKM